MSKPFPTKAQVVDWIRDHPGENTKRDIARAFGIKGSDRIILKAMLKELEADGELLRDRGHLREPGTLPPVTVLRVTGPDDSGDLWAQPAQWDEHDGPEPRVLMRLRANEPALGEGDRILARLAPHEDEGAAYTGRLIRRIGQGPRSFIGVFREGAEGHRILSIDRKSGHEWLVSEKERHGAQDGELVEAEQAGPKDRMGLPRGRITARLGDPSEPKAVSLIAIHTYEIPHVFPQPAIDEAEAAKPVSLGKREDLRHLPLITIDPADARDRDDAICAMPDPDVEGGHILWVAIADVAHYVRPGGPLDTEARNRGNSTYFPDRVVPMLPEALSADLCSLHGGVDRACLAVEIRIDAQGNKRSHRFTRGLMRSAAALSYRQAQSAIDGDPDDEAEPLLEPALRPLWDAHGALTKARNRRQPLNLVLPEREIVLSDDGHVTSIAFKEPLEAHRLIEDFMVLANVCAAETLEKKRQPLIYRIHDEPDPERIEALRKTAEAAGLKLAKGQVINTRAINKLLAQAEGHDDADVINMQVLRAMQQAVYSSQNIGHFGLSLRSYAHFTSPIRRYADLMVHRALIKAHRWGKDGLTDEDEERLEPIAEWISQTERRSMLAERETTDRYLAAYMSERIGNEYPGRVSGVTRFGIFVKLDDSGADGLVPIRALGGEFYRYDRDDQTLMGEQTGTMIRMGQRALIRVAEAEAVTGGLIFELLELEGEALPSGPAPGRRKSPGRGKSRKRSKSRTVSRNAKRKSKR